MNARRGVHDKAESKSNSSDESVNTNSVYLVHCTFHNYLLISEIKIIHV